MKKSKLQISNFREASSSKLGKYPQLESEADDLLILRDGPLHSFDLEERTAVFGEAVIKFVKTIPRGPRNDRIIDQLVGASTSVGANYLEASERVSKKDFRNTISRCVKEAKETKFFLRMAVASEPQLADEARKLYREAKELHLILQPFTENDCWILNFL